MGRVSRFPTVARFDRAGGAIPGVVYVVRAAGIIGARPHRRRRVYELPLSTVADYICRQVLMAESRERNAERRRNRRGGLIRERRRQ